MIPIRDKRTDISSEVAAGKRLKQKIVSLSEEAADTSINTGTDLNEVIANIALRENFNRLQIQRLVEESNTVAYNKRYDKLRNSYDRRITFPIASLDGVVKEMGDNAPEEIVNPNLATGREGTGEIQKAASSIESTYIHNPHTKVKEQYDKYLEKVAAAEQKQEEIKMKRLKKDRDSNIFKIANSLVMSERMYKNANMIFNTMLSDVSLPDEVVDGIKKKASYIGEQMVKSRRCTPGFVVTLKENFEEKTANYLLGEYSLLKKAEDNLKVQEIKIQPTADIKDFNDIVALALKLEKQQQELNQKAAQTAVRGENVGN